MAGIARQDSSGSSTRLLKSAALVFALASLLFHLPAVAGGRIPSEDDVETFYFPFLVDTARALREGSVRLWTPSIFGGYPLFADGEAGMLYPLHLLLLPRLTPEAAFVALKVLHTFLAAIFTFYLLRTLRVGALGGIVGGLTYALSGFAAAQVVHSNVFQAMVWLPLELALAERICLASGIASVPLDRFGWPRLGGILRIGGPGAGQRYRYAALAGAVFGVQALGFHVHVTLMSGIAVSAFFAYRWLLGTWRPPALLAGLSGWWRWPVSRLAAAATIGLPFVFMAALGMAVAAVQLLPLYELGIRTYRSSGLPEPLASVNSIWPGDLLILLLPHLHWTNAGGFWGPWVNWETTLYVGIIPLVLACVGLLKGDGPYRPFFLLLSAAALLLTLGPYAPVPLWDELRTFPGFSVLRSPGRFVLLLTLGVAVGAAYGVDWLGRRRPSALAGLAVTLAGALAVLAVGLGLELATKLLVSVGSESRLVEEYLALPGIPLMVDGAPLTKERAIQLAAQALTVSNPATAWQLGLALASVATLAIWLVGGLLRPLAVVATVGLVITDLWVFSLRVHPYAPISTLRPQLPSVFLQASNEPFRVLTPTTTRAKDSNIDPNRGMIAGVQEANGYSSLESDRHYSYIHAVGYADNHLLDLWNVRYVVRFNRQELFPSHEGVSFHPQRPLFSGKRDTPGAGGALLPDGGPARASEVRVVGSLWDAASVEDNQPVAQIVLEGSGGERRQMGLVAGQDLSDMAMEVPGGKLAAKHRRADVAFAYQREDPDGDNYGEQLSYAHLPIAPPLNVTRVVIERGDGEYGLQIYGIGLFDQATGEVTQAMTKAKYRLVHSDSDFRVYENRQVMPRAFLVGRVVSPPPELDALSLMMDGPFDPAREVVLPRSAADAAGALPPSEVEPGPVGTAVIERYEPERVVVRVAAERRGFLVLSDAYDPGWVAKIDGKAAPIFRANYQFRAVPVPSGDHTVVFAYRPVSVALGALITVIASALIVVIALVHALGALRRALDF